jgi:hypothetical protein
MLVDQSSCGSSGTNTEGVKNALPEVIGPPRAVHIGLHCKFGTLM